MPFGQKLQTFIQTLGYRMDIEKINAGCGKLYGERDAVLVADVARSAAGETRFLLLQSFMPAQQMHILKNLQNADASPWYPLDFGDRLLTPEWVFPRDSLRRWR